MAGLTAVAAGVEAKDSIFSYARGECIVCSENEIQSVRGLRYWRVNNCQYLLRCLNYDYINMEINENSLLPVWLTCDVSAKAICLNGTP